MSDFAHQSRRTPGLTLAPNSELHVVRSRETPTGIIENYRKHGKLPIDYVGMTNKDVVLDLCKRGLVVDPQGRRIKDIDDIKPGSKIAVRSRITSGGTGTPTSTPQGSLLLTPTEMWAEHYPVFRRPTTVTPQSTLRRDDRDAPRAPVTRPAPELHTRVSQEPAGLPDKSTPRRSERMKSDKTYRGIKGEVAAYAKKFGVPPNLALAVVQIESSFNPWAHNKTDGGSRGLMQVQPDTAKEHLRPGEEYKPFDKDQNLRIGMKYLKQMMTYAERGSKSFRITPVHQDDIEKFAVAAYNTGPRNLGRAQAKARAEGLDPGNYEDVKKFLPRSTQRHIEKVLRAQQRY